MRLWKYIFILFLLILLVIIIGLSQLPDDNLHIIACDVGQGDALLVTFGSTQILTDGGPDTKVLDCLGRYLPFWDRTIELVVSTHPDSDHSTGLTSVIKRYKVVKILVNSIDPSTEVYRLLEKEVGSKGVGVVNPIAGQKLRVGMIYLDVLNPTEEMLSRLSVNSEGSKMAKYAIGSQTNLYSIVYRLSFKKFSGFFPGDAPPEVAERLSENSVMSPVNYIKIPHHGSANGLTENLLKVIEPKVAVISVSAKNMWGFPAPAILNLLSNYQVRVLRTDQMGDVEVVTDGEKMWWKK